MSPNLYHYRCNNSKCNKCCKKAICNAINCINCQKRGISCKWLISRTQDEFDLLKSSVTYSYEKFEQSGQQHLHFHLFLQFQNQVTMRNVIKDLFNNDEEISFSPGILLKGSSKDAKYYVGKHFRRCKIHYKLSKKKYCKCNLYDLNDLGDCQLCTIKCYKQRKKEQLDELGSGIFKFRQYRLLLESTDNTVDMINNSKLENIKQQEYI
ncbi:hypothetical protein F8M41_012394 [Gigaspora margarita]|uniref:Replication protein n=1 Tax=Gigaspora margarita TaxID=4874 RepID=A0A8H3WYA7_GIGMA|nr:hypothetical protein F8M41_012394 [Gigaspora margarita]